VQLRTQKIAGGAQSKLNKMYAYHPSNNLRQHIRYPTTHHDHQTDLLMGLSQPRRPQIHRPLPDRHQHHPTPPTPPVLREEEVPPPRPQTQADPRHASCAYQGGGEPCDGEAEEEAEALPPEELRREGAVGGLSSTEDVGGGQRANEELFTGSLHLAWRNGMAVIHVACFCGRELLLCQLLHMVT